VSAGPESGRSDSARFARASAERGSGPLVSLGLVRRFLAPGVAGRTPDLTGALRCPEVDRPGRGASSKADGSTMVSQWGQTTAWSSMSSLQEGHCIASTPY
jgi:hypothetical protein